MESHLRRRRINARRMSQMAFLPPTALLAGLAEQGESSVPGSESLSRASTQRQSHRIRRSLRETPPTRSRSNSLQVRAVLPATSPRLARCSIAFFLFHYFISLLLFYEPIEFAKRVNVCCNLDYKITCPSLWVSINVKS